MKQCRVDLVNNLSKDLVNCLAEHSSNKEYKVKDIFNVGYKDHLSHLICGAIAQKKISFISGAEILGISLSELRVLIASRRKGT